MNHIVIRLISWSFLAIGVAMLIGAALASSDGSIVLLGMGVVLGAIGGGLVAYGVWSKREQALLRQHGHLVQAEFQQVEINESLEVNGSNPFRIVAQWHDTTKNRLFIFKSENLWFDPTPFVKGKTISVYVDLDKPSRYHVDTTFLPTMQG
ncbi:MAG: hypothetical protein KF891_02845 [Rhizobacter sp.]|nr:hypothetical protein [Rhizobacter sp.]